MNSGLPGKRATRAAIAIVSLAIATCGRGGVGGPGRVDPGNLKVVLIVIDTGRADFMGPYGSPWPTTPWLDEIASEGITFEHAFAPSSWTVPSMFSMFTGLWPSQHGMTLGEIRGRGVVGQPVLPDEALTLTETLERAGWDTFGVCTNFHLNDRFGFTQGFDRVVGSDFAKLPFPDLAVRSLAPVVRGSERSFTWIHYLDPHGPYRLQHPWFGEWNESGLRSYADMMEDAALMVYRLQHGLPEGAAPAPEDVEYLYTALGKAALQPQKFFAMLGKAAVRPPEEWIRFARAAYAGEIRATDEAARDAMEMLGDDDRTILVVVADHGEELFERGNIGHRGTQSLYQELLHVPLIVRLPGGRGAGRVIDEPVSLVDIMPTILDLLGLDVPPDLAGRSLVPLIDGRAEGWDRPLYAEMTDIDGQSSSCLVEYPWKYIHEFTAGTGHLYRLDLDPGERHDLSGVEPARALRMRSDLLGWTAATKPRLEPEMPSILSPEDVARLKALGYLQ